MKKALASSLVGLLFIAIVAGTAFHWIVNRVYVDPGESLMLRYKGPLIFGSRNTAAPGHFAKYEEGEIGVIDDIRGPGRHFFCPIWWERTKVKDSVVEPGQVAIVTSKMGDDLPRGQFLVDGRLGETQQKGVLRKAYGPGRYRYNTYAYEFRVVQTEVHSDGGQQKVAGWVEIPTGYVGVVTNLASNPLTGAKAGIQNDVLPPGLYPINPKEQQIDIIEIGYREKTIEVAKQTDRAGKVVLDESGEPAISNASSGINFPSDDAFPINMDFTAIWGIMPDQAASAVKTFGTVKAVEDKVIVPQIESICRNSGSKFKAVDLLVGQSRQQFQSETSEELRTALSDKSITLLYGLVRHIYIPTQVRVPIQNANIANELKLTRDQEQLTAKTEASLREAERKVELEAERINVETTKKVAQAVAEGDKTARETDAESLRLVAAIDKETAVLEAQATVLLGQARADAEKLLQEAKAAKFKLAVEAFGAGEAYNQWIFASGLPDDIELNLLYAGEGTFWTDLQGFVPTLLGRQVQQEQQQKAPAVRRTGAR